MFVISKSAFSPSRLSASTFHCVLAWIMTCHCFRHSAISVFTWFLAISSFTRGLAISAFFCLNFPTNLLSKSRQTKAEMAICQNCLTMHGFLYRQHAINHATDDVIRSGGVSVIDITWVLVVTWKDAVPRTSYSSYDLVSVK